MTGKPIFRSNHFKDLTPEEFQSKYLTGYTGPTVHNGGGERGLRVEEMLLLEFRTSHEGIRRASDRGTTTSDQIHHGTSDPLHIPRHSTVQE